MKRLFGLALIINFMMATKGTVNLTQKNSTSLFASGKSLLQILMDIETPIQLCSLFLYETGEIFRHISVLLDSKSSLMEKPEQLFMKFPVVLFQPTNILRKKNLYCQDSVIPTWSMRVV